MNVSWIITGLLALIVGMVVYAEIRHGRRSKVVQRKIDHEIEVLHESVVTKYRAKFGREPTNVGTHSPRVHGHVRNGTATKKA